MHGADAFEAAGRAGYAGCALHVPEEMEVAEIGLDALDAAFIKLDVKL
jgi:hypothetical protein